MEVTVLPDSLDTTTYSRPQRRSTEEIQYPYSPLWERKRVWLPWKSNDQERGLQAFRVTPGGRVEESGDRAPPRKKIKAISSCQWGAV
jgi:hypothetical protein